MPLSLHLTGYNPILFYYCDLYTTSLRVQKYNPDSEVPPYPAQPLLLPAQKVGCLSMEMHGG